MNAWLNLILARRARQLLARLAPHLPRRGCLLDVGSGTGHNAAAIERATHLRVTELDVADLNALGRPAIRFDGRSIPLASRSFDAVTLLFVLHYAPDPVGLLRELRRVSRGPVLILQSVHAGPVARVALWVREWLQGRLAFHVAACLGFVRATACPLQPLRYFTRAELVRQFSAAGLRVASCVASAGQGAGLSRDLYVLERDPSCETP